MVNTYTIDKTVKSGNILEKDIQFAIERNITLGLGLTSLGCEYQTDKGRIDILCIDDENHLVIIECKLNTAIYSTIAQVISYRTYLINNKNDIETDITRKLNINIKIDWSLIRCICIAEDFDGRCVDAALSIQEIPGVQMELIKYTMLNESTFILKNVSIKYEKQIIKPIDIDSIYNDFWLQMNGKNIHFDDMFDNDKRYDKRYLGTSAGSGMTWYAIITSKDAYIELYFTDKNKYSNIYLHRKDIDIDFGNTLDWTHDYENRTTCRIHARSKIGGINDKDKWDDIQTALIDKTMQLVKVLQNYL